MEKHTHDYKDTIKEAAEIDTESDVRAVRRARKTDAEIALEMLAVNSSMNMLGMEQPAANLYQLELAQEVMFKYDERDDDGEFQIGD